MTSLLIVATNKYINFLPDLVKSVRLYFFGDTQIHIFTDRTGNVIDMFGDDVKVHEIEHRSFPYPTLYRYHFFKRYLADIRGTNVYYVDADTRFTDEIDFDHSIRTAVEHCGYVGRRGTYEYNNRSMCYVSQEEGTKYYGGGFWGFSHDEFVRFVNKAVDMVNADLNRDIMPIWHDESVLNRYLIDNPPTQVLSPSYHYPENNEHIYRLWGGKDKYKCKLLLLDKDHKAIRE